MGSLVMVWRPQDWPCHCGPDGRQSATTINPAHAVVATGGAADSARQRCASSCDRNMQWIQEAERAPNTSINALAIGAAGSMVLRMGTARYPVGRSSGQKQHGAPSRQHSSCLCDFMSGSTRLARGYIRALRRLVPTGRVRRKMPEFAPGSRAPVRAGRGKSRDSTKSGFRD